MQRFQHYLLLIYHLSFTSLFLSLLWCLASVCDKKRWPVAEFMCESIIFCSTCMMSFLKTSRSLSHLLMSFLSLSRVCFLLLVMSYTAKIISVLHAMLLLCIFSWFNYRHSALWFYCTNLYYANACLAIQLSKLQSVRIKLSWVVTPVIPQVSPSAIGKWLTSA